MGEHLNEDINIPDDSVIRYYLKNKDMDLLSLRNTREHLPYRAYNTLGSQREGVVYESHPHSLIQSPVLRNTSLRNKLSLKFNGKFWNLR